MKPAEPFLTNRKRIRNIRITKSGWAFILLTIGLGFAGLNTGNNLLYLIFGTLLSMLLINGILSTSSLHGLSVNLIFSPRLYAVTDNPIKVEVQNHKRRLPSYAIVLSTAAEKKNAPTTSHFLFKIPAGSKQHFVHYHRFLARGMQPPPRFIVHTAYPFGLIQKFIPIPPAGNRLIYPQLKRTAVEQLATTYLHGEYLSGKRGIGVNPYGVREFQYGDDIRRMHWRSFAKLGKWVTKEFEQEKKSKITLHLIVAENPPAEAAAKEKREAVVSLVASLLMYFIEQNRQVGLWINGRHLEPLGMGYIDFFLSALALFDSKQGLSQLAIGKTQTQESGTIVGVSELSNPSSIGARYDMLVPMDTIEAAA